MHCERDNTVDLDKRSVQQINGPLKTNRDISQKEAIHNYEFTLTPRALFSTNGEIGT